MNDEVVQIPIGVIQLAFVAGPMLAIILIAIVLFIPRNKP